MFKILEKEAIAHNVWKYVTAAPDVANNTQPGQFVVLRLHERGERIPISISRLGLGCRNHYFDSSLLLYQPSS